MENKYDLELRNFLPHMLNQVAQACDEAFQNFYKTQYGMLETEWLVLFNLGTYGDMTAKDISERDQIHKTKISRAVSALEKKRFLTKREDDYDRRLEHLSLTSTGQLAYSALLEQAKAHQEKLAKNLTCDEIQILNNILQKLAKFNAG